MKREKEVPAELLAWMKYRKEQVNRKMFNRLNIFCTMPVRAVRMKMLRDNAGEECYRTAIIPPVDVYTTDKMILTEGYLKRDALSYFIAGTHKVFPYGHIYANSGYVCLGSIFVPSAVPEYSTTMPLETLFLHNDRNLNHGGSSLIIDKNQSQAIGTIIEQERINLSILASRVVSSPGTNLLARDEIWALSADVADQEPLPDALLIMEEIYKIIFPYENTSENDESEGSEAENG